MKTEKIPSGTLRLLMPQWQGGNYGETYPLGARLLAWLAPESAAPLVEVPVENYDGTVPPVEGGIVGKTALLKQQRAARKIIEAYQPDRVITFGGDCLVSQSPFAYLNERYDGDLGVLWIDAHPDVTTPRDFAHEHAMVLGNLLGEGDPDFAAEVKVPIKPGRVLYVGVDETLPWEAEVLERLNLARVRSDEVVAGSGPVIDWIEKSGVRHLAIHLDLDVLDPGLFRSLLFNNPDADKPVDAAHGRLSFPRLTGLITDVAARTDVVGLSIAEYMPWDAINLKNMMAAFPFMK